MNRQILYFLSLMGLLSFASCTNDEDPVLSNETGEIRFSVVDTTAVEITTKAPFGLDVNTFKVNLTRGNESLFSGIYGDIAGTFLTYSAGEGYLLTAVSCTEAEAESANDGWGQARVYGEESFAVVAGDTTEVTVSCGLVNSSVEVDFSDFIKSTYEEYSMEVHTDAPYRSFTFNKANHRVKTAYYNVGKSGKTLYCTVNLPGFKKPFLDTLEMVPSQPYKLMVKVIGEAGNMDVSLDISVDDTLYEEDRPESINPYE